MSIEQNDGEQRTKGPEIKLKGPEFLDPLTMTVAKGGLIIFECLRHPLSVIGLKSWITTDRENRVTYIEREMVQRGGKNG